jgi:hypothetical protein
MAATKDTYSTIRVEELNASEGQSPTLPPSALSKPVGELMKAISKTMEPETSWESVIIIHGGNILEDGEEGIYMCGAGSVASS